MFSEKFAQYVEEHNPEYIIGIDEVGWGAIAGPLVLGCAVYPAAFSHKRIKDSKSFTTERSRQNAKEVVDSTALYRDVHFTPSVDISRMGAGPAIRKALFEIAERASCKYPNALLVIDGTRVIPGIDNPQLAIDKADAWVTAVSAASILAKVARDEYMSQLYLTQPEFEWDSNKGYPTQKHLKLLQTYGVSQHHRLNIDLVKDALMKRGEYTKGAKGNS